MHYFMNGKGEPWDVTDHMFSSGIPEEQMCALSAHLVKARIEPGDYLHVVSGSFWSDEVEDLADYYYHMCGGDYRFIFAHSLLANGPCYGCTKLREANYPSDVNPESTRLLVELIDQSWDQCITS